MEIVRKARFIWTGSADGRGMFDQHYSGPLHIPDRKAPEGGNTPEDLISRAFASCFTMGVINVLKDKGFHPEQLITETELFLDSETNTLSPVRMEVCCEGFIPEIAFSDFRLIAEKVKDSCPVSRLLDGNLDIILHVSLKMGIINQLIL